MKYTTESWIQKAKELNGGNYDYSKVQYISYKEKVCIICPIHGETFIHNWLTSNNFASQHELYLPTSGKSVVRVDFWITYKDKIYAIEYNGKQHYQFCSIFHKDEFALLAQQQRDNALQDYCDSNKIKLLWVKYDLTFPQVESELRNFFGVEA